MQQLAKRIHNGHAYLRQDPKALTLKPSSMDLNVGQHAQAGQDYQARYGQMYARRTERPVLLPKTIVDWLQEVNKAAAAEVGALQTLGRSCWG